MRLKVEVSPINGNSTATTALLQNATKDLAGCFSADDGMLRRVV